jgi:TrmH family RNA methyltransferase
MIFSSIDIKEVFDKPLDLKKISALAEYLSGSFKIPLENKIDVSGLIVALDSIRDPGNGDNLEMCDWFGVTEIKRDCGLIQSKSGSGYHGVHR